MKKLFLSIPVIENRLLYTLVFGIATSACFVQAIQYSGVISLVCWVAAIIGGTLCIRQMAG